MRVAFVLLPLMLLLGGCGNRVMSETPWFTKDAEANAPRLKPGLWVATNSAELKAAGKACRFDERKPMETWPDCAAGFVARDGEILTLSRIVTTDEHGRKVTSYDWPSTAYVLAAGDPRIEQEGCSGLVQKSNVAASDAEPADATSIPAAAADAPADKAEPPQDSGPDKPSRYCYAAIRPTKLDSEGRITAFVMWPVLCGPWPTKKEADGSTANVTDAPFPGLRVVDDNCVAESVTALREAAKASEAVAVSMHFGPFEAHWVRDGYR
jgi:hypothetical protein